LFERNPTEVDPYDAVSALVHEGIATEALGQYQAAINVMDDAFRRFGGSELPAVQATIAKGCFNKAVLLGILSKTIEELDAYDKVVREFGSQSAASEWVAKAMLSKGNALGTLGRHDDQLVAYRNVVSQFGDSSDVTLLEQVVMALHNTRVRMTMLGRTEDALATISELVTRFAQRPEESLRGVV
jgi:hypothetical protein